MRACGTYSGYGRGCRCEACKDACRAYRASYKQQKHGGGYAADSKHRVDAAPLHRLIEIHGGLKPSGRLLAGRLGGMATSHERRLARILTQDTVSVYTADEVCLAFGRHPIEVYGLAFYADLIEQEGATDVA